MDDLRYKILTDDDSSFEEVKAHLERAGVPIYVELPSRRLLGTGRLPEKLQRDLTQSCGAQIHAEIPYDPETSG